MGIKQQVSKVFPKAEWTGESSMHVSIYREGFLEISFEKRAEVLYSLTENKIGHSIWEFLQARFSAFEWLLEPETFEKLFLVDVDRQLQGLAPSSSPNQIKNPSTGNVFHRIALLPPYVGGIRFWCYGGYGSGTMIGFRFRIVKLENDDEEIIVRDECRAKEALVIEQVSSVYDAIMEFAEPPQSVHEAAKMLTCFA